MSEITWVRIGIGARVHIKSVTKHWNTLCHNQGPITREEKDEDADASEKCMVCLKVLRRGVKRRRIITYLDEFTCPNCTTFFSVPADTPLICPKCKKEW